MLKISVFYILLLSYVIPAQAQVKDSVFARVIFIGDAGKIDEEQKMVIHHASQQVMGGRTKVVFLGDNIYPVGMGLPGSKEEEQTKLILRSQFVPMLKQNTPVYFIPGNHDWDRSGKQGLAKVKRQSDYLKEQNNELLTMAPANGCPDPIAINVHENLTLIAYDSEWWLFPYAKNSNPDDCACKNEQEVLDRLKHLVSINKGKILLVASHHPFKTYGEHSGYKKTPVFGGMIRFLKSKFPFRQDTGHPVYQHMVRKISEVFNGVPNVIYVAGHDHGLQYIEGKNVQLVSGAGAKKDDVYQGEGSLFAATKPGYVIADLLPSKKLRITFFAATEKGMQAVFTKVILTTAAHETKTP